MSVPTRWTPLRRTHWRSRRRSPELDRPERRKQVGAVSAISASGFDVVGVAAPTEALVISAFSAISATGGFSEPLQEYFPTAIGRQKRVSASFRRFPPVRAIVRKAPISGC